MWQSQTLNLQYFALIFQQRIKNVIRLVFEFWHKTAFIEETSKENVSEPPAFLTFSTSNYPEPLPGSLHWRGLCVCAGGA